MFYNDFNEKDGVKAKNIVGFYSRSVFCEDGRL